MREPGHTPAGRPSCRGRLLGIAALLAALPLPGQEDPRRIEWLEHQFPPFYIHEGEAAGQGIADAISDMIRAEMSGWSHVKLPSELADTTRRMRDGDQVCSAAYLKTPQRERYMEFSIPHMILPPNGITIRRADLERFGGGGPVAFAELIEERSLKLAFAQGRAYGPGIDAVLDRHRGSPHVYPRIADDIYRSLFEMLLKGSTDYILGFPYEAVYLARELGVADQIVSLPIVENREYVLSHIVCAKTPWGAAVVAEIDAAIRRLKPGDTYREAIERWLGEELLGEFRARYAEYAGRDSGG